MLCYCLKFCLGWVLFGVLVGIEVVGLVLEKGVVVCWGVVGWLYLIVGFFCVYVLERLSFMVMMVLFSSLFIFSRVDCLGLCIVFFSRVFGMGYFSMLVRMCLLLLDVLVGFWVC